MDLRAHHANLAVQTGCSILGIAILPLSIGHVRLLTALGLSNPGTLPEMVAALLVCSRRASDVLPSLKSRWWRFRAHLRAAFVGACVRLMSGRSTAGPVIVTLAAQRQFGEYVRRSYEGPAIKTIRPTEGSGIEYKTPQLAHIEHTLSAECGIAPADVFDMPISEAVWRFAVSREASGTCVLAEDAGDDEYEELQRKADEFEAKHR